MTTGQTSIIEALAQARTYGIQLTPTRGDPIATPLSDHGRQLAEMLNTRRPVLAHVRALYTREAVVLDWGVNSAFKATMAARARCRRCGLPTTLRDPYDRLPWHKICAERAIGGYQ